MSTIARDEDVLESTGPTVDRRLSWRQTALPGVRVLVLNEGLGPPTLRGSPASSASSQVTCTSVRGVAYRSRQYRLHP
jgi:hypothetical protein